MIKYKWSDFIMPVHLREIFMKKIISAILLIAVIAVFAVSFVACAKEGSTDIKASDENLGNYEGLDVAEGMSAYDLIMEAYNNWINDTNYVRDETFKFQAGNFATRDSHLVRKVVGDKIYSEEIIYGTGMDSGSCAKRYYFDGENAYNLINTNKKDLTFDKDTGKLSTSKWGDFAPFTGDVKEENRVMTEHLTTYDFSKKEYLSDKHDDKVYVKDGIYYCTMTLDCSTEMMTTVHRAALDEFLSMTGAKEEGFTIEDTTIDFAIANVDGKYKFMIWKRNEKYQGNHKDIGFIKVSCEQTCLSYYTYNTAEITAQDLLNLA